MAKKTKAQELARLKAEYEARQPRVGAPTFKGMTPEEARAIRESWRTGGQGDPDEMLGRRMNPIVEAPMFLAGVPTGPLGVLENAATTIATLKGVELLAETNPTAAKVANLGLIAASAPGVAKATGRAIRAAVSDMMAEPTAEKVNLLYEMLRSQNGKHKITLPDNIVAEMPAPQGQLPGPAPQSLVGWNAPAGLLPRPKNVKPRNKPGPSDTWSDSLDALVKKILGTSSVKPTVKAKAAPRTPRPDIPSEALDKWTADLASRYGKGFAEELGYKVLHDSLYGRYLYGDDWTSALAKAKKYENARAIFDAVAEPNEIVLGGSSSIGSEGTIRRGEIGHDLDFQGYIANASRRADLGAPGAQEAMVEALRNRANIENAPVIQKLRKLYPELKDAKFRYASRPFEWYGPEKYQPDVFTVPIPEPQVTPTGEANLMVNVKLNGQNVDLMLTDGLIIPSKANPRLGSAETALHWKDAYRDKAGNLHPKHAADIAAYREYSDTNMRIDPRSGRAQFDPFDFPSNRIMTDEGLPVVVDMETNPGSGETMPVMMNADGRIIPADDHGNMLYTWYSKEHPQNNPRYTDRPATAETHPLVAIRGAERFLRMPEGSRFDNYADHVSLGLQGGEPAPGIGVYPAVNPELLADEIISGGRWSTYHSGKHKDMIIYPRRAVDPEADTGNVIHAVDAYWDSPYFATSDRYRAALDQLGQSGSPENIDRVGRLFGTDGRIPTGQYTEIGNAYRNRIYKTNPQGHYNQPPGKGIYDGYGEARHLGYQPDGTVIPGELIDRDPETARAMLIDAIKKNMFGLPIGAAGLTRDDEETQQAAKGGDTRAASKGGDGGPSEDIPPEPGEGASSFLPSAGGGPRIVINPTTFRNKKDALCVAFNEGFRLWMEANDFQPRSEPTDAQRKFFSDTAYADDELQLRRTILARIATFDTSVKDPTDDQLAETAEFLGAVLESGWCKNEWERDCVSRLAQAAQAAIGAEPVEARQEPLEAREAEPLQARAAMGGGETDDEEKDKAGQAVPAQETDSGMDLGYAMERMGGVAQQEQQEQQEQDVNGDGTVIDHSADYEAQLDSEHQEDAAEANAEYEKLRQSGALDDPASFDNSGQMAGKGQVQETAASPGLGAEKSASQEQKSEEGSKETGPREAPRRGAIENDIVSKDSPGSLSYKGQRPGAIENDIVSKDSPGSLSYKGQRPGAIEDPIVNPASQGSIGFSGVRDGGIERPTVDPGSPGSLSYRRRRRNRR